MKKPYFIDLFAGCGGLSLGLMEAGWQGLFAIEKSPDAFATLSHNLLKQDTGRKFEWPEWLNQESMTTQELLNNHRGNLLDLQGKVDLIAGGPPCQGFSFVGLRNPNDPRNRLTEQYIEIVNIIQPRFLLLENVKGFQAAFKGADKPYSKYVQERLEKLENGGYHVYSRMLEASLFGVPQPRARFIMLAVRKDVDRFLEDPFSVIQAKIPSFRDMKGLNGHATTAIEAIGDLEISGKELTDCPDSRGFKQIKYKQPKAMSSYQKLMRKNVPDNQWPNSLRLPNHKAETLQKFQEILEKCPKGKSISKEFREYFKMKKQCFTPLHPNRPARTVTTLPDDMLHYCEPRILTVRENARLQSFPDWFEFKGKYTTGGSRRREECPRYTQVGNAVPPLMAEAIGRIIYELGNYADA